MKIFSSYRIINAVLVLALLVTALIVYISVKQSHRVVKTGREIEHTHTSLTALNTIVNSLLNLQSGSRAYLLTGDTYFLKESDSLKKNIQESLNWLHAQKDYSAENEKLLDELTALIQKRLEIRDELLRAKGAGELTTAYLDQAFQRSGLLEKRIQQIRQDFRNAESAKLNQEEEHNARGFLNLNIILYLSLAAVLVIGLMLYRKAWRQYDQHKDEKKRFSIILEAAPDAMILVNREGLIRYCNAASVSMFGYTIAELKGMSVEKLVPEDLREKHARLRNEHQEAGKSRNFHAGLELPLVRKEGETILVEISLSPVTINKKSYMLAAIRDISARKAAEEEVRTLYQQVNQAYEAIAILNTDFTIRTWNKGAEALFGYTPGEAIGMNAKDQLLSKEDAGEAYKMVHGNLDQFYWAGQLNIKAKDQTEKIVHTSFTAIINEAGKLTGYVAVSYDITESTRLQKEVEYLASIVEQSGVAIFSTDMDRKILSWNRGAEKLHGYTAEEAIGYTVDELGLGRFTADDLQSSIDAILNKGSW